MEKSVESVHNFLNINRNSQLWKPNSVNRMNEVSTFLSEMSFFWLEKVKEEGVQLYIMTKEAVTCFRSFTR